MNKMDYPQIIEKNKQAIIPLQLFLPGANGQAQISVRGTGFVVSRDGTFVTNAHVYDEIPDDQKQYFEAQTIEREEDGITYYKRSGVELLRTDKENDIMVMRLKDGGPFKTVAAIGDAEKVKEGDEALFVGYPLATELIAMGFGITMTANHCIVSSVKRRMQDKALHLFMIDTHTNNGSSGSPLFSRAAGEVIGIVSGRISGKVQIDPQDKSKLIDIPANMGICRPISYVKTLIK